MRQTIIDAAVMPKAWLTWHTTKATFYVDCETNEKSNNRPDVNFGYPNNYKYALGHYITAKNWHNVQARQGI